MQVWWENKLSSQDSQSSKHIVKHVTSWTDKGKIILIHNNDSMSFNYVFSISTMETDVSHSGLRPYNDILIDLKFSRQRWVRKQRWKENLLFDA